MIENLKDLLLALTILAIGAGAQIMFIKAVK